MIFDRFITLQKFYLKYFNLFISLLSLSIVLYYWYKFINFRFVGSSGPEGFRGLRGNMGPSGNIGFDGADIDKTYDITQLNVDPPKGPPGSIGKDGLPGPDGVKGPQGPIGVKGLKGKMGPNGIKGLKGPKGPDGVEGDNIIKSILLLTKFKKEDCMWTIDQDCPDNMIISGIQFDPLLSYKCCPTRLHII